MGLIKRKRVRIVITEDAKKYIAENYNKMAIIDMANHLGYKYGTIWEYVHRVFKVPIQAKNDALIDGSSKFFDVDNYLKTVRTI